jgi:hypothetical protein
MMDVLHEMMVFLYLPKGSLLYECEYFWWVLKVEWRIIADSLCDEYDVEVIVLYV